jgi:hypothetical protein
MSQPIGIINDSQLDIWIQLPNAAIQILDLLRLRPAVSAADVADAASNTPDDIKHLAA